MVEEKRHFSRVEFQSKSEIVFGENIYEADLVDISLRGALVQLSSTIENQQGDSCSFKLSLHQSDIVLKVETKLVYKKDGHLGLKFGNIDLDSMIHLRRLVELNTGDPELIKKELFFLIDTD